ncbi:5-dehydro-2-deoxygluconokinase [Dirofilaria immitis]
MQAVRLTTRFDIIVTSSAACCFALDDKIAHERRRPPRRQATLTQPLASKPANNSSAVFILTIEVGFGARYQKGSWHKFVEFVGFRSFKFCEDIPIKIESQYSKRFIRPASSTKRI